MQVIPDEIYELIMTDLTTGLAKEEKVQLQEWLDESEDHQQAWEEVCGIWMMGRQVGENRNDLAKHAIWNRVTANVQKADRKRKSRVNYAMGIAASVLLLIGAFWMYTNIETTPQPTLAITLPEDEPTITLEDGRVFTIDELKNQHPTGLRFDSTNTAVSYSHYLADTLDVKHELFVPKGGKYQLELSDGTLVTVNAESRLKYVAEFNGAIREVWLQGEAFFQVAHDEDHPFIVHSGDLSTQVLGTEFNVMAYDDEQEIKVTLVEGSVKVQDSLQTKILVPGNQAIYRFDDSEIKVSPVDVQYVTGWTKDILYFQDVTLEELLRKLNRWYDLQVTFADESVKNRHFTGGIQKKHDAQKIFSMIEKVNDVRFEVEGRKIIIAQK